MEKILITISLLSLSIFGYAQSKPLLEDYLDIHYLYKTKQQSHVKD